MIYNTPGIFPNLKVVRNDLDRRRKREPQIWFQFEATSGPLVAEFDYDNYFITITGDLSRIQAFSKMLVALKLHKKLNNFKDPVCYKVSCSFSICTLNHIIMYTFCQRSTGNWSIKPKLFIIHPNLFYRLQIRLLSKQYTYAN